MGKRTYIALDSDDDVHISYWDVTNDDLKYATNQSGSWVTKAVDSNGNVGTQTSLAIDSDDNVHISYYGATNGDLKYATLQGVHPWNVYGYSISPALPAGLSLNFTSGEISGTPTAISTNTTYTITARNTGGANTTTITIVVNDVAPSISYSNDDIVGTLNVSISPHSSPTNSGGAVTSWEI